LPDKSKKERKKHFFNGPLMLVHERRFVMKCRRLIVLLAPIITVLFLFVVGYPTAVATAVTTYGTLDNFDVINDTGGETHGFEIELEGISAPDVVYTFGAPYQRYGDPTLVPTPTGVIIHYAASYTGGTWSATTPVAVAPYLPTQGHSCWTGGVSDPAIYYAAGCDHFGASLNATPTKTTYRWLVESAPGSGTLIAFGSNPPLPAPVWNVTPPAPGGQPIAAAVIAPPASADPTKCGDALWAKVYVTELPSGLQADDLDHMVIDDPNVNIVPNEPAEIEFEWVLLQACPNNAGGEQEFGGGAEVGAGNEAVSRRFEFYKYTGQYDPDPEAIKEALCDNPTALDQQLPLSERCGAPDANGVAGVGDLIGAQNVAVNLAGPVVVPNHPPVITGTKPATVDMSEDGSPTAFSLTLNATDMDGDTLTWSISTVAGHGTASVGGTGLSKAIGYTPTANYNGSDSFGVQVSDGKGGIDTITVNVIIAAVNDPPVANAGANQSLRMHNTVTLNGSGSSDVDGNPLTYSWSLITVPAHSKAVLSGATSVSPTFVADKAGTYVAQLVVNDGTVNSAPATVTITATKGKK
jgi:hypothetical protein